MSAEVLLLYYVLWYFEISLAHQDVILLQANKPLISIRITRLQEPQTAFPSSNQSLLVCRSKPLIFKHEIREHDRTIFARFHAFRVTCNLSLLCVRKYGKIETNRLFRFTAFITDKQQRRHHRWPLFTLKGRR